MTGNGLFANAIAIYQAGIIRCSDDSLLPVGFVIRPEVSVVVIAASTTTISRTVVESVIAVTTI